MIDLISTAEACKLLGIGRETLVWLEQRGDLEFYRVTSPGGRTYVYVKRDDAERLKDGAWRRYRARAG